MIEEPSRLSTLGVCHNCFIRNLIRTTTPIPQKNWTSFYFEAKIVKGGSNDFIAIGLTEADPSTRTNCILGSTLCACLSRATQSRFRRPTI